MPNSSYTAFAAGASTYDFRKQAVTLDSLAAVKGTLDSELRSRLDNRMNAHADHGHSPTSLRAIHLTEPVQEAHGSIERSVQTDSVKIVDDAQRAAEPFGALSATCQSTSWSGADDLEHAEAMQMLKSLGERNGERDRVVELVTQLERDLHKERCSRRTAQGLLAQEHGQREAAQQQVLCLEYELDGKEMTLQMAEQDLAQREKDLVQTYRQLQDIRSERPRNSPSSITLICIHDQLADYEHQLDLKDQHISQLYTMLGQKIGSSLPEVDTQTSYGSDQSVSAATPDSPEFTPWSFR